MQRVTYYIDSNKDSSNYTKLVHKLETIIGITHIEIDKRNKTISFIFNSVLSLSMAECYIKEWCNGELRCLKEWSKLRPHNQVFKRPKSQDSLFA